MIKTKRLIKKNN